MANISGQDESNFEDDDDDDDDETDYALFSDIMSYFNNNNNHNDSQTSRDLNHMMMNDYDDDDDDDAHSLDYTPVKGDKQSTTTTTTTTTTNNNNNTPLKKFNYAPLKIDSIRLPAIPRQQDVLSTVLANHRKRYAPQAPTTTPIIVATNKLSSNTTATATTTHNNYLRANLTNNYSSDTDSSLVHQACCSVNPLKMRWNSNNPANAKPKTFSSFGKTTTTTTSSQQDALKSSRTHNLIEEFTATQQQHRQRFNHAMPLANNAKKVKFHLK
jgi:hypothetical protein